MTHIVYFRGIWWLLADSVYDPTDIAAFNNNSDGKITARKIWVKQFWWQNIHYIQVLFF